MPNHSGVYMIRNTVTGDRYIGCSKHIETRWKQHRKELVSGLHHCQKLQVAWAAHGAESFEFTILEEVTPPADPYIAESRYLREMQPEYNTLTGKMEVETEPSYPFDILVSIINDSTGSVAWNKLWERLLRPLPDELEAAQVAQEGGDNGSES